MPREHDITTSLGQARSHMAQGIPLHCATFRAHNKWKGRIVGLASNILTDSAGAINCSRTRSLIRIFVIFHLRLEKWLNVRHQRCASNDGDSNCCFCLCYYWSMAPRAHPKVPLEYWLPTQTERHICSTHHNEVARVPFFLCRYIHIGSDGFTKHVSSDWSNWQDSPSLIKPRAVIVPQIISKVDEGIGRTRVLA